MNIRNKTLIALLTAGGLALALPLSGQARPMGGMEGCESPRAFMGDRDGLPRMMKRLDLTDAQKDQISQLRQRDAAMMAEKFKTLRETRSALRDMRLKDEYDAVRIKMLTEQGALAMAEMAQMRARQHHEIWQILTPEQRQRAEAKRERMRKHWHAQHGAGGD